MLPGPIGNTGAGPLHGQSAGYLGSAHEPFFLNADPARPDFKVADLEVPTGQSGFRLDARRKLLGATRRGAAAHRDLQHPDARRRLRACLPSADLAEGEESVRPEPRETTSCATAMAAIPSARAV